jgi:hypothetical protein
MSAAVMPVDATAARESRVMLEAESEAEDEGSWSHQLMVELGCRKR